jgi:formylglycine-generating enzyme required for sulfatase activity
MHEWPSRAKLAIAACFAILMVGIGAALVYQLNPLYAVTPLSLERERVFKPKDTFKECANCPEMVVVSAGRFMMGSTENEPNHDADEVPQHAVTLPPQFAIGRFAVIFDEWDGCVADGGCHDYRPDDNGWGRGRRPVINVSWDDAKAYVAWLSRKTGKSYRLPSEAEREYATRAGSTTAYSWGDQIGNGNANCRFCGSRWDGKQTAPVGSFAANAFGLYDMHGKVWEWVEDCYHDSYNGAPTDGSAWTMGNCAYYIARGGSWGFVPRGLRSATRGGFTTGLRENFLGFRVGRTLTP